MYSIISFKGEYLANLVLVQSLADSLGVDLGEIPKVMDKDSERYKVLRSLTDDEELIAKLYWVDGKKE